MSEMELKTLTVNGPEGRVRSLFANRQLQGMPAEKHFPGIGACAILPKDMGSEDEALEYLKGIIKPGGNAAAVKIAEESWLIAAWVQVQP